MGLYSARACSITFDLHVVLPHYNKNVVKNGGGERGGGQLHPSQIKECWRPDEIICQ